MVVPPAGAVVRYVNLANPGPTPPYTNWATAATAIQDAVDAANAGDEIVVTNSTTMTPHLREAARSGSSGGARASRRLSASSK